MGAVDGKDLLLAGLSGMVYNGIQVAKAPFRKQLRKKYEKRYNDPTLFELFANDTSDIMLRSDRYNHMESGNGLFLFHLIEAYRKKGIRVKLLTAGSRADEHASYFRHHYDFSVTEIDMKTEHYQEKVQEFLEQDHDVLSINAKNYYSKKAENRKSCLPDILQLLSSLPHDNNVVYLACVLFVYNEDEQALLEFGKQQHVRLVHLNLPPLTYKHKENHLNLLFTYYMGGDKFEEKEKKWATAFPTLPVSLFKKNYFGYGHFFYEYQGKTGVYFMEDKEKEDE